MRKDRSLIVNMAKQKTTKNIVKSSRKETWMRIVIGIISGIILGVWGYLICLFFIVNFVYGVLTGKRLKELAEMSETWNTQMYFFKRYLFFVSQERPFPFNSLAKNISEFK